MNMVMELGDEATVQGKYSFRVSVLVGETVIREQFLPATKDESTVFELSFPETRGRMEVRCRTELFIDGNFIEAREKPLVLWPPLAPIEQQPKDKVIWVFDTSGALQKIFQDMQVHASDATFQAIRDFQVPNFIFVGEDVSPKSFPVLTDRILSKTEKLETVVFLRQKQFPEDWPIQVASAEELSRNVLCDPNSALLSGLSRLDIMNMVNNAMPAEIAKREDNQWKADSHISEMEKDEKEICSYLAVIQDNKLTTVYCQLPLTKDFNKEPRSALLFRNLLEYVFENNVVTNH
jgi:acetone carboxylase gamma subunit